MLRFLVIGGIILCVLWIFLFSESGIIQRMIIKNKILKMQKNIEDLTQENKMLKEKIKAFKKGQRDVIEEELRKFGYLGKDEKILLFEFTNDYAR